MKKKRYFVIQVHPENRAIDPVDPVLAAPILYSALTRIIAHILKFRNR